MATRVRVARRAVRRGRSLVARPAASESSEPIRNDDDDVFDVESRFVQSVHEPLPDAEPSGEPSRRASYSRPPAPMLALTAPPGRSPADDEEQAEEDPNATTLVSGDFETPSRPSAAPTSSAPTSVSIVEAADEPPSTRKVGWLHAQPGFVPEADEAALDEDDEEAELDPTPTFDGAFFREQHASLLPVVDDLEPPPEPELLTPEQSSRRAKLRRGVGIGVMAAALLTVGIATKAAVTEQAPHVQRHHAAAMAATELPKLEAPAAPVAEQPSEPSAPAASDSEGESGAEADDPAALGKEAVRLLNQRKPELAAEVARKLIALQPDNAYGYRCLGAALQDMGKYPEARQVYSACVTTAVEGDVQECGALGGAKRKR